MDPTSANLDRIQIVKGWSSNGQSFERIYDVAWSGDRQPDPVSGKVPPVGNTVNLMDASYTNTIGAPELSAVWVTPTSTRPRCVLLCAGAGNPHPRWSTIQALQLGEVPPVALASSHSFRSGPDLTDLVHAG